MFEYNSFYNMDCMEGMAQLPDKYFELAIVDPPYGLNLASLGEIGSANRPSLSRRNAKRVEARQFKKSDFDKHPPDEAYFVELFRVSRNQIIWGANHFCNRFDFSSPGWIVWDKCRRGLDFADCEIAYSSFNKPMRIFEFRLNGFLHPVGGKYEPKIHINQKPVALYRWLLKNYAKPGDKILDTHVGSTSSLIACYEMEHDYIGFELDKDYYAAASKRLENAMKQKHLFSDETGVCYS